MLRCALLRMLWTYRWLAGVFATTLSNLSVARVPIPLWFSTSTRRVRRRMQSKSRIARGKCFGGSSLQPFKNSIPEKPRLRLRVSRATDMCPLIDVRGLLPSGQIDIAGLQQAVILLERNHCALNVRTVDAVGLNRTTICGTITIRCQGSLHIADAVACFPESGYVVVNHRQRLHIISKRSLHRQAAVGQVLNVVFILLEILGIHFEMGMDAGPGRQVETDVALCA